MELSIILVWLMFSIVVGFLAKNKDLGFAGGFFASAILSPIIGLIIVAASKDAKVEDVNNPNIVNNDSIAKANKLTQDALALYGEKKYDDALNLAKDAVKYNPNDNILYYNLACCYSKTGDIDKAFKFIEMAVSKGYANLKQINEGEGLAEVRKDNRFEDFSMNGYRFEKENI